MNSKINEQKNDFVKSAKPPSLSSPTSVNITAALKGFSINRELKCDLGFNQITKKNKTDFSFLYNANQLVDTINIFDQNLIKNKKLKLNAEAKAFYMLACTYLDAFVKTEYKKLANLNIQGVLALLKNTDSFDFLF